jgi:xanthine dehydrogenase large subunit
MAARELRKRLLACAAERTGQINDLNIVDEVVVSHSKNLNLNWEQLVNGAYLSRINLSAQAHYATPNLHFDKTLEKGHPFAYHVYGTACVEATVDILRGTATIDSVQMLHDAGRSINPLIDQGQAEGAVMQGIGWLTMEELAYAENGRLLTDTLTTYKIPDIHSMPETFVVDFLEDADNPHAVLQSKGIGEPPFLYGIGAYFAIVNALKAARPNHKMEMTAPLTHERILQFLTDKK